MNLKKTSLFLSLVGATFITLDTGNAVHALTFSEPPDAGPLLTNAANTVPTGVVGNNPATDLTRITGRLSGNADLFRIQVGTGLFEAIARGIDPNPVNDTQLFLFDVNGFGIAANDDFSGGLGSRITQFLTAGIYYLGISKYDLDPVSRNRGTIAEIFPDTPFTAIVGPTGPGGAFPLFGWRGTISESGRARNYEILLSSTPVPTPALLPGLLALGAGGLRKRRDEVAEEGSEA
ncbi:PTPA-CTERM sorting domain-containing protein [Leptothermofonsia sp. ETS-13]|uniref:PTPA-CTERM sorting domain-containing protein n=1 Tax=Leptothermofonsia sp. ETS-13 TaxID=3035696 RepID=UPI003BA255E3